MRTLQFLSRLLQEEDGQDLIEYALVAALVGLAAVTSIRSFGNAVKNAFTSIGTSLSSAI